MKEKILLLLLGFVIGIIATILTEFVKKYFTGLKEEEVHDKKVFLNIKENLLPVDGAIGFLKDFSFYESYEHSDLKDFFIIKDTQMDENKNLFNKIKEFILDFSIKACHMESNFNRLRIPKDEYNKTVKRLDDRGKEILEIYKEFMYYGRKKLKI